MDTFFSPISGYDSKIAKPAEWHLTTVFCYGCNLGPTQVACSLGTVDRRQIAWINERHVTEENIQKIIEGLINAYNQFKLLKYWRTGNCAADDGTKWDPYKQNLLSKNHIRYGGDDGSKRHFLSSYNDYAMDLSIWIRIK